MFITLTNDFGKKTFIRAKDIACIDVVLHPRDNVDLDKFVTRVNFGNGWILTESSPEEVFKLVQDALNG